MWLVDEYQSNKIINITFDKIDNMRWWECAIRGHTVIDTGKINPEPSKLSDLDGEMRTQGIILYLNLFS